MHVPYDMFAQRQLDELDIVCQSSAMPIACVRVLFIQLLKSELPYIYVRRWRNSISQKSWFHLVTQKELSEESRGAICLTTRVRPFIAGRG